MPIFRRIDDCVLASGLLAAAGAPYECFRCRYSRLHRCDMLPLDLRRAVYVISALEDAARRAHRLQRCAGDSVDSGVD